MKPGVLLLAMTVLGFVLGCFVLVVGCSASKPTLAQEFTVSSFGAALAGCVISAHTRPEYEACRARVNADYGYDAGAEGGAP